MKHVLYILVAILLTACSTVPVETIEYFDGDSVCPNVFQPVCGSIPVQCITAPCPPIQQSFANECLARLAGAVEVLDGVCE